jgi:hypothetical protein
MIITRRAPVASTLTLQPAPAAAAAAAAAAGRQPQPKDEESPRTATAVTQVSTAQRTHAPLNRHAAQLTSLN